MADTASDASEIRLSDAQATDLLKQVRTHYDLALRDRPALAARSEERYRRYLADPTTRPPGPWPEAARLFMPYTRDALERVLAQFFKALFGNASLETLRFEPFGEEDVERSLMATRFARWALHKAINGADDGGFPAIANMALFDALLDSAGVLKCSWYRAPWSKPATSADGRWLGEFARVDNVDQGRLLVPFDASGLQFPECRYLHQEIWVTPEDLRRLEAQGYRVPAPDQLKGGLEQVDERRRAEMEREGQSVDLSDVPGTWLVESYERFPLDGARAPDEDIIVWWFPRAAGEAAFSKIRRMSDLFPAVDRPRRPFFRVSIWPQPRQWRGLNMVDRLESPQDILNRIAEQAVNYADLTLTPWIFYNAFLTGELPDLRQIRPGTPIPVNSLDGVQWFQRLPLTRFFSELSQFFLAVLERDSGVTDFNLGRQPDRPNMPRTLGGTLAILQQGQQVFSYMTALVKNQFEGLLTFYFQLWQKRIPPGFRAQVRTAPRRLQDLSPAFQADVREAVSTMNADGNPTALARLLDRLFLVGAPPTPERLVAMQISDRDLFGLFDASLTINPDQLFEQQALLTLAQTMSPLLADYPLGLRELWRRVWEASSQHGFEQIWPLAWAQMKTTVVDQTMRLQQAVVAAQSDAAAQQRTPEQDQPSQADVLQQAQQAAPVDAEQGRADEARVRAAQGLVDLGARMSDLLQ